MSARWTGSSRPAQPARRARKGSFSSILESEIELLEPRSMRLQHRTGAKKKCVEDKKREHAEIERSAHRRIERGDHAGRRMDRPPHIHRPVDKRHERAAE